MSLNKWTTRFLSLALVTGCGLTVAEASCTLSLCRERGHGYDCHSVDDSPEWVCRQAKSAAPACPTPSPASAPAQESTPSKTKEHHAAQPSTATSTIPPIQMQPPVPIQAPVIVPEPDLIQELEPDLEPAQSPPAVLVPSQQ